MMSGTSPSWRTKNYCYAHEQCLLANEQWSRLLDELVTPTGKGSILPRSSVDACLNRLLNNASLSPVDNSGADASSGNKSSSESSRLGLIPWKSDDKRYSPGLKGLDEEIIDFMGYISPMQEEYWVRQNVVLQITHLITELWPEAKVEVFGSYATGLFLPTSDIDVVVMYWEIDAQTPDVMEKALMMLEAQLLNKGAYDDVKVIRTSVPIVKLTDRETAIKVDVGFNVTTGADSIRFIKEKMIEYPQLMCLVFVLKQFLVYHNLLESFNGGISSYCLILLIISYLQLNCDEEEASLGQHLIRFLELYGCHFNYLRTGIKIRDGGSYFPKKDKQDGEVENRYQFSLLCIEDPVNVANDVGKGCYGAMKVRDAFADAYRDLRDAVLPQYQIVQSGCSTFLGRILRIPRDIFQYRRLMTQRYTQVIQAPIEYPVIFDNLVMSPTQGLQTQAVNDDRSDSGSVSSQSSNPSSVESSQGRSVSAGSAAVSDNESDAISEAVKPAAEISSANYPVQTISEPLSVIMPCYTAHPQNQPSLVTVLPSSELTLVPTVMDSAHLTHMTSQPPPAAHPKQPLHGTGWTTVHHAIPDQPPYATRPVLSSVVNSGEEVPLINGLLSSPTPAASGVESSALLNRLPGIAAAGAAGVSGEFPTRTSTVTSRSYPASSVAGGNAPSATGHVAMPARQHGVRHFKPHQARVTTTASVSMSRPLVTQSVRPPTSGSPGSNDRYHKTNSRYGENGVNYMNGR